MRAVVSDAMAEVGTFSAMIVELPRVELGLPVAEARDEVAPATVAVKLLLISAFDGGMFSSIFIFVPAVFNLVQGVPDGAGELFATTHATALQQHVVEIKGALLS